MQKYFITLLIVLAGIYASLFFLSISGWGYPSYNHHSGRHRVYSFWYWGRPDYYMGKSVRSGSVRGSSSTGGGIHGGK